MGRVIGTIGEEHMTCIVPFLFGFLYDFIEERSNSLMLLMCLSCRVFAIHGPKIVTTVSEQKTIQVSVGAIVNCQQAVLILEPVAQNASMIINECRIWTQHRATTGRATNSVTCVGACKFVQRQWKLELCQS